LPINICSPLSRSAGPREEAAPHPFGVGDIHLPRAGGGAGPPAEDALGRGPREVAGEGCDARNPFRILAV
jgi:hypothetical protein